MIYFNIHRVMQEVLMFKQQQEIKQKVVNYELLEEILNSIKDNVEDNKTLFQEYVKASRNEGLNDSEIWKLAKEILASHVALRTLYRWGHEYLNPEAFDTLQSNRRLGSKKSVAMWQPDLKQQIEYEDPSVVEDYYITDVHKYSREFLIKLCQYLDSTLELNCRGK